MILTGPAIEEARDQGKIVIEPFKSSHLNPNSYNFRLADTILRATQDGAGASFERIDLKEPGVVLQPRTLYLGATLEIIGSTDFAMTLLGRSSLGRLGLFLNITADLGHVGAVSQWTLELTVVQPLRIYRRMRIGQVAFWKQSGTAKGYDGRYHLDVGPIPSRDLSFGIEGIGVRS